MVKTRSLYLT